MAPNPVVYAEETLGVHKVWDDAQKRQSDLESALNERLAVLRDLRSIRTKIADREAELTAEAPANWPDANATERSRLLKTALRDDGTLKDLRAEEAEIQGTLDLLDSQIESNKAGLRVLGARMVSLGGLLNFYAASKYVSTQGKVQTS